MVLTFCLVKIFNFLLYNIKNKMYFHKKLYLIFGFITLYLFNLYCVLHIAPSNSKSSNVTSILYNCIQCSFFGSQRYIFGRNDMCFLHDVGQNGLFFNKWGQKGHSIFKTSICSPSIPRWLFLPLLLLVKSQVENVLKLKEMNQKVAY